MKTNLEALQSLYQIMTGESKEFTTNSEALEEIAKNYIGGSVKNLPKLFLVGDITGISKDDTVNMVVEYVNGSNTFTDDCTLKWQGTSSLNYPKKNFTIKLNNKFDLGFGEQKKYCLKANYIDHSHARNIVSARLWSEIVASRTNYNSLPTELKNTPNNGAIDGFPIKLYLNGTYEGIYTLNIPKDAWMFNMDDEKEEHCVLCGENYSSGCFRATAKIDGTDWSDEIHDTVPATILARWNEIISFVMDSTDVEFKANIDTYIDLESLIDYYIFAYVSCGLDSMGKNQIYCTYDGVKWYASMYDMDSTWGLYWNGSSFVSAEYRCQEDYESMAGGAGNALYLRLAKLFSKEVSERYDELRKNILSINNIILKFEEFTDLISSDLYAEDVEIYTGIPSSTTNNIKQIRTYAKDRLAYVDSVIKYVETNLTDIELSGTSTYVNTRTKLTTTLTPENANNYKLTYTSSDETIATVDESGVVTGIAEGVAVIKVSDSISGLSATLNISVNAEKTLEQSLIFTLNSNSVVDGVITDFEKNGITYPVTTNGTLTVDESDSGIEFSGTNSFLIDLTNSNLSNNVSRTITATFMTKSNFNFGNGVSVIFSHSSDLKTENDLISNGTARTALLHQTSAFTCYAGNNIVCSKVGNIPTVTIHKVASVYDEISGKYKVYLDGVLVGETTNITDYMGIKECNYICNYATGQSKKLYQLSLYDRALTDEEIASL